MRFACSTASFPEDRVEAALARVAWAGYDGVEIPLLDEPFPEEEALRARLRAEDLELAAVFAGTLPAGTGEAELGALARIGRAAALARALDGSQVILRAPAAGDLVGLGKALELLDLALGGLAADLCLVNRRGTLLQVPEDFRSLWQLDLPDRTGIALDPGESVLAGCDPADLEALPELPRYVYLNDADRELGRAAAPGDGDLDLERLGRALRREGYGGTVCLLLENADPWAAEPIAREVRAAAAGWF